jgi:GT2 family glycosyltransferase
VRYVSPVLKTTFDHEHLLSHNYIGNAFACSRELYGSLDGFDGGCSDAYGYDFLLRASEKLNPADFQHLERILYHRRAQEEDGLGSSAAEESSTRLTCVNAHLERLWAPARAEPHSDPLGGPRPTSHRIIWELPDPVPMVSIIIPTRDRADLMEPCLQSVFESQAHYPVPFEIIVMDNESSEPETLSLLERAARDHGVTVIPYGSAFNWSAINNLAAREARGDILLFLNNDTRVLTPGWVRELASHAIRPDVGAVGARLLYEDGTIQHAGVVLGGRAVHESIGQRPSEGGYCGRTVLQRNVSAVTGACLATRKSLFQELGGFDEINLKVAFNDVDYCLKLRAAGYAVVYTPFATLYHFESKSRGLDDDFSKRLRSQNELRIMRSRWHEVIERDPFYNSRFNRTGRPFTRLRPPELVGRVIEATDDDELWELE